MWRWKLRRFAAVQSPNGQDGWKSPKSPNRPAGFRWHRRPAEHIEAIVGAYYAHVISLDVGSDVLAHDHEIAKTVVREFAKATGRRVPAPFLIGRLTKLRKRGLLPKVGNRPKKE